MLGSDPQVFRDLISQLSGLTYDTYPAWLHSTQAALEAFFEDNKHLARGLMFANPPKGTSGNERIPAAVVQNNITVLLQAIKLAEIAQAEYRAQKDEERARLRADERGDQRSKWIDVGVVLTVALASFGAGQVYSRPERWWFEYDCGAGGSMTVWYENERKPTRALSGADSRPILRYCKRICFEHSGPAACQVEVYQREANAIFGADLVHRGPSVLSTSQDDGCVSIDSPICR